jgi:hypothetical protein
MKQIIPTLVVITNQPMGCMFPTEDLFRVVVRLLSYDTLEQLHTSYPEPANVQQTQTLIRDTRARFMPTLLHGDGDIST